MSLLSLGIIVFFVAVGLLFCLLIWTEIKASIISDEPEWPPVQAGETYNRGCFISPESQKIARVIPRKPRIKKAAVGIATKKIAIKRAAVKASAVKRAAGRKVTTKKTTVKK